MRTENETIAAKNDKVAIPSDGVLIDCDGRIWNIKSWETRSASGELSIVKAEIFAKEGIGNQETVLRSVLSSLAKVAARYAE